MRILVIGGTYFLGKAFAELACGRHELTLLNRGTREVRFSHPEHVREIHADRHSLAAGSLSGENFDLAADFCAYQKGDIRQILEALNGRVKRYLFVSTCDVYRRGTGRPLDENGELESRDFGGEAGAYILGKAELERELEKCAGEYGISCVSVRPAFLYGPDNYAPREGIFFRWIDQAGQILCPEDADGSFQMVYVEDAAKILLEICEDLSAVGDSAERKPGYGAVNLCGPEKVTYGSFCEALRYAVDRDFEKVLLSREEIRDRQIPLPFPMTLEESETYVSLYEDKLNPKYISLGEGLRKTYDKLKENLIFETIDKLFDANQPKEAENYMLRELQKAGERNRDDVSLKLLNELIGYYRQTSEAEPLLKAIGEALALTEKMGLLGTISHATTALNAANAYRSIGKYDESLQYYKITDDIYGAKIREGVLKKDDMLLAGLYNNRSLLYQELSDYEAAKEDLTKALEISKKNGAFFETAVTYANLANTAVAAGRYQEAEGYADTAVRLFQARGLRDPHYCAALSALGTCYYKRGLYLQAEGFFRKALRIVEETFGQNGQYVRLKENCDMCEKKRSGENGDAPRNGLELARRYYETYGAAMIREKFPKYESKIAVGLSGEGSDCFGFDDELSADHDYGPDFCMWLSDETYEAIGEKLQQAYDELPREFAGYVRQVTPTGQGRRGVLKISDYYKKFLGTDIYEKIDFDGVEDYALAACVNGEVFRDDEGIFTAMRNRLQQGLPADIRLLKIAREAAGFSQCGQYNYGRMLQRKDALTAEIMLSDCLKHAMKLYHHMENVYPPHDKWLYKSLSCLEGSSEAVRLLDQIQSKTACGESAEAVQSAVEELGQFFAGKLYEKSDISDVDPYLDHHVEELLFKAGIARDSVEELVKKVVRLEFEAFDKVKNEGGRAYCQNDWPTFSIMRKSQYLTWDREMLMQYYYDFNREYRIGHNLITEKYGRMMESTAPEKYAEFRDQLPELSEEKKAVIEQIVRIQMDMVEALSQEYPGVVGNARSLHTYEDNPEDTSYETYLRGEISVYSDKMLQLYGRYVASAARRGENLAHQIMENTAKLYGYRDLDEFEAAIRSSKR